jgi:hypothetical protein
MIFKKEQKCTNYRGEMCPVGGGGGGLKMVTPRTCGVRGVTQILNIHDSVERLVWLLYLWVCWTGSHVGSVCQGEYQR